MNDIKMGKYISYLLRHHPEKEHLHMDQHGYVSVKELINSIHITLEDLERIVKNNDKQRYSFNNDHTLIRANQGHSIPVDVQLETVIPPTYLYHGTSTKYQSSIEQAGLIKKSRLYVHLSKDIPTAIKVGQRHGQVIIYRIDAYQMYLDGYTFYLSKNNIYLVDHVPIKYLKRENHF